MPILVTLQQLLAYHNLTVFKMADVRHLVLDIKIQHFSDCQHGSRYQSVEELPHYDDVSIVQNGGRPPSWFCLDHALVVQIFL